MILLFSVPLFLSAMLLFWMQPLFARMILPLLGGTPAVWNGCMVFFQGTLLAGYLWAHLSTRFLGVRRQPWLHLAVGASGIALLPIAVAGHEPPAASNPLPWLLTTLLVSVGLPAFALSGTAPLLQRWFVATGHTRGRDPYFLYAASNAGSLAALLAYPFLFEPALTIAGQARIWTGGYVLLLVLVAACALATRRGPGPVELDGDDTRAAGDLPWRTRIHWVLLALVPSSLLLGVTTHISTNIAAVPLFWVVPLSLYLLTFVLTFARRPPIPRRAMLLIQPPLLLAALIAVSVSGDSPVLSFPLHLAAFFVTAMVCHGELAAGRPDPAHLTEFYLWLSFGGVVGGILNTFAAPAIFTSVAEYPLMIAAAFLLRPRPANTRSRRSAPARLIPLAPALLLAILLLTPAARFLGLDSAGLPLQIAVGLSFAACLPFARSPLPLGVATVAVASVALVGASWSKGIIVAERNAFGVVKVRSTVHGSNVLISGTTVHGAQSTDPDRRREPLTYYRRTGPLGEILAARSHKLAGKAIAVIGLGAGTMAAYGEPGQRYDFYEIDPAVERVARDPRLFTYLADSPAETRVILGDGRLRIAKAPDRSYALIVLDAFSSDAIPVHLLTREALGIYLDKLEPGGAIAFHITNRHLDLLPVIVNLAAERGMPCLNKRVPPHEGSARFDSGSSWALVVRSLRDAGAIYDYDDWRWWDDPPSGRVWTDDYVDLLRVMRFG